MRKLGLSVLVCGAVSIPLAARSQDDAPIGPEDFVCAFAGECGDGAADEAGGENPAPDGRGPRISATRGFSLGSTAPAARPPRRPGNATTPSAGARGHRTAPARGGQRPARQPAPRLRDRLGADDPGGGSPRPRIFGRACDAAARNMRSGLERHTDAVGIRARNVALSQRRAQSLADFLVAMGVARGRLEVRGYGPDRPLPGTSGASAQNRRVEAVRLS